MLSGGGTGGHIYPAIAIANELKLRYPNAEFLFVGAKDRMEMDKVPQAGYKIEGLWISGIQRRFTLKNLLFPLKLILSLWTSYRVLQKFKPNVVIGTGGFASGPLLKVATLKKIPSLIQEQNSFPGITNKLLSKKVNAICVAYQDLERFFPEHKIKLTGNPIRKELLHITEKESKARVQFKLENKKLTLLVLGGSLGARRINQLIASNITFFKDNNIQVIWQCGKLYYEQYQHYNKENHIQVHAFLNQMDLAYAASDIIISRAGAISVSELCIVGKPVIFIPSPNVAEDHQTKNAKAVADKNAAILIKESHLEAEFQLQFTTLISNSENRNTLSKNIKALALPNATTLIADEVETLLKSYVTSS